MLAKTDPELGALLGAVEYTGIAVVALGFRSADLPGPLHGYGYLVTKPEGLATLGVSWESSLFAGRAPAGHVLMRVMLGGSRVPGIADRSDDECSRVAREELARVMGITADPVHLSVSRWPAAIAQYTLGHGGRLEALRARVGRHPGLHVCGTSYDGVSLNHAVKCARAVARGLAAEMWGGHADAAPSARELVTA
jgi:oxygen-dependent protoporphyrinogen oxidase